MKTVHLLRLLSLFTVVQQVGSWVISLPTKVTATAGSCALVPCQTQPHTRVIWYKYHNIHYPVVYDGHKPETVESQFSGRTSVVGNASEGTCTLMIEDVQTVDNNLKVYVWIDPDSKRTQKFHEQTVTVSVETKTPIISVQKQIVEGDILEANCSIEHSCPSSPPRLHWINSSFLINSSFHDFHSKARGQWLYSKLLHGIATRKMQDSKVKCSAQFRTFTTESQEITLNILYKPNPVMLVLEKKEVMEGDSVTVQCSANSNPPTHTYSWISRQMGRDTQINSSENKISFDNITQDTSLSCMAHNNIGEGQSDWHDIHVLYAPVILPGSSCSQKGSIVRCVCLSEASTNASITWITDGNDTIPSSFNSISVRKKNVVSGEIHVPANIQINISCRAWNKFGNVIKQLHVDHVSETSFLSLLWSMLLGSALLLGCAIFIYKKYPKNRSHHSSGHFQEEESCGPLQRQLDEDRYQNVERPERDPEENRRCSIYDNDCIEDIQRSMGIQLQQNNRAPQNKTDEIELRPKGK